MNYDTCEIFKDLLEAVPHQVELFFKTDCDVDSSFMGFTEIYKNLAKMIPEHFTIVDLGCAYAPQSYYFRNHKKYLGIDLEHKYRFHFPNSEFWIGKIADFVHSEVYNGLDQESSLAICSYVPPWYGDNQEIARTSFQNVFSFYPSSSSAEKRRHAPLKDSLLG